MEIDRLRTIVKHPLVISFHADRFAIPLAGWGGHKRRRTIAVQKLKELKAPQRTLRSI